MMETQDEGAWGMGQGYNELVIDSWRQPFKPEWVKAVFVQPGMAAEKIQRAKSVLTTFTSRFGEIPLLEYDANATDAPFSAFHI